MMKKPIPTMMRTRFFDRPPAAAGTGGGGGGAAGGNANAPGVGKRGG